MKYIVTGIGTEVGKTIVCAVLVQALQADYWKPVQAGSLAATDTDRIRELTNTSGARHPEAYRLQYPASPHKAAKMENVSLDSSKIVLPDTNRPLIIEQAGGVLSPFDDRSTQADLFSRWNFDRILVSRHYLGSINHTLLSIEYMKLKKIPLKGIVFNGPPDPFTEEFILGYTGVPCLARIAHEEHLDSKTIAAYAEQWKGTFR